MKLKVIDTAKIEKGSIELPAQFNENIRPDVIKRAVQTIQSHNAQPYGASPDAGKRSSAYVSKRRRAWKTTYGIGQSRTPRKVMSHRGTRMNWTGAFAPQTVGGRRSHPPKASKIIKLKLNKKENRFAIRSAMSATLIKDIVKARGHKIPETYPFVLEESIEKLDKTSKVKSVLKKLGFEDDLKRASVKKVRAGRGTMRGRKYNKKKSLLLVVSEDCPLVKAAKNIPGIDIVDAKSINTELLAPGTMIGRATLFTTKAIKAIGQNKLFI